MNERAPFAMWHPGNPAVTGYGPPLGARAPKRGAVCHSAEGSNWDVIHDLLTWKSWHFTIGYDRIEQHHDISVNCWHAGDTDDDGAVRANIDLIGIEALGVAGEALNEFQIDAEVLINRWSAQQYDRSIFRRFDGWEPDETGIWVLGEHNEVSNTYTDCPSGRIPWDEILLRLAMEDAMEIAWVMKDTDVYGRDPTYLAMVCSSPPIMRLWHIPDGPHEDALRAAGFIGLPQTIRRLNQQQLAQYTLV